MTNPKVSILIPAFNKPLLFKKALESALQQTYDPIEIIICDDSTNYDTHDVVQPYLKKYSHIRYFKNGVNLGQFLNDLKLLELSTGEYINYLMDDDLFHPQKIEKMMRYFTHYQHQTITLVTSHRLTVNIEGEVIPNNDPSFTKLYEYDSIVEGAQFADFMLKIGNCIGEPTTVLFKKEDLKDPFGVYANRPYGCNVDMATWMSLLEKGKLVYIAEPLSYYRSHEGQQSKDLKMIIYGAVDLGHMVSEAYNRGLLQQANVRSKAIARSLVYIDFAMNTIQKNSTSKVYKREITELLYYKRVLENVVLSSPQ
ncbi:glycosyltransferase family 2 protein [Marininema halotolerans]|uniref:Glycosyl transferase family 2 n=1 Tax=Marininema halotolerans TaxID=1155944 RepID=A0A1I6STX5_9BACL|nr:glycosyltransferase family 2 protein [Marininema halotolerans]SFS80379.1 Glycosyl transferase family 2 [Marininema halotolerans]